MRRIFFLCPFKFNNHLTEELNSCCFAVIVFAILGYASVCLCYVSLF